MTELRQRMIEDMRLHGLAEGTQRVYVDAVKQLTEHCKRSPDRLAEHEVRDFFIYLTEKKKLARSTVNGYRLGPSRAPRGHRPDASSPPLLTQSDLVSAAPSPRSLASPPLHTWRHRSLRKAYDRRASHPARSASPHAPHAEMTLPVAPRRSITARGYLGLPIRLRPTCPCSRACSHQTLADKPPVPPAVIMLPSMAKADYTHVYRSGRAVRINAIKGYCR